MANRNIASLNEFFHKETIFVHMDATMNKEQELGTIRIDEIHYKHTETEETSIRFISNTAIILSQIRLTAVVGGNEVVNPFTVAKVYIQINRKWKLVSLSFTRLFGDYPQKSF